MDGKEERSAAQTKRRRILGGMLGVSFAAVVSPILYALGRYLGFQTVPGGAKDALISIHDVDAQHPSKLININEQPVLVIYEQDKGVRAFNATCTHLGCTVSYQPQVPGFYCKCHQGRYDANGVNVPGTRPQRPLTELTILTKGDQLDITLTPKGKAA